MSDISTRYELSHDFIPDADRVAIDRAEFAEHRRFESLSPIEQAYELLANAKRMVADAEALLSVPADADMLRCRRLRLTTARSLQARCEERIAAGGCRADTLLTSLNRVEEARSLININAAAE